MKVGAKVRIVDGAIVGQDFSFWKWDEDNTIFTVDDIFGQPKLRCRLIAEGYGTKDNYGNGAVYANMEDLRRIDGQTTNRQSGSKENTSPEFDNLCNNVGRW